MKKIILGLDRLLQSNIVLWLMVIGGAIVHGLLCFGQTIWLDEALTGTYIRMGWAELLAFTTTDVHPPLYYFIVKLGIIFFYMAMAKGLLLTIVMLSVTMLLFILVEALRITMFTCFAGYTIDSGKNPFKSFFKSVTIVGKSFGRVYSNVVAVIISIVFVNSFVGLFTVLSGLLVTVPASMVFCAIFYQVVYFSMQGRRYYLTNSLIVNPIN